MKNIVSYAFLIFYLIDLVFSHKACGIDLLKKPKRILVKQENENKRILQQGEWEPIRIHLDFSYIENNLGRIKKEDLIDLKDKIMPKVQEVFQKLLKVKRIQHKLKLNAPHCETFPIPEKYHDSGEGVDADIVIFVLVDDSGFFAENRIEAAAIHCIQHYETRRPIAGYIQFKPDLKVNNSTALDYMVWLAVHEVTHILVINNALYDDYIDSDTLLPKGYDRVVGSRQLPNGKKMNYIKSQKVLEKAKNHFNCDFIEGVPLEYNGGAGTAGAHWSKKYMNTDYMIGDSYGENLISDITLALFEDSGWYKVDYELSNLFLWGKDTGCNFFNTKCIKSKKNEIRTEFPHEYCTKLNYPMCSPSNIFRASCYAKKYKNELSIYERYFDDPKVGGVDALTDKCPVPFEEKGGQAYYGGSCRVGSIDNIGKLEKICPECACFLSTLDTAEGVNADNSNDEKRRRFLRFKQDGKEKDKEKNKIENLSRVNTAVTTTTKVTTTATAATKTATTATAATKTATTVTAATKTTATAATATNAKTVVMDRDAFIFNDDPQLTANDPLAACFQTKCQDADLYIVVYGKPYRCPSEEKITIPGYKGFVICPRNEVICHMKFKCKFGCTEKYDNSHQFVSYREEIKKLK